MRATSAAGTSATFRRINTFEVFLDWREGKENPEIQIQEINQDRVWHQPKHQQKQH